MRQPSGKGCLSRCVDAPDRPAALMPPAAPPGNERARLAAVRALGILDSPPDPRFTLFTRLAARLCEAPVALVSLVDEGRQWFKAVVGLDDDLRETPRDQAFCAHALLRPGETLVVRDATADARFADNPLVLGDFQLRAYAGAPLIDADGHALGTLCVLDRRVRDFSETQLAVLRDLADGVAAILALHAAARRAQDMAARDPLTGVANRAAFEAGLAAALEQRGTAPRSGRAMAVLLVDLDRFKWINDFFGHAAGDAALCAAAHRLDGVLRGGDLLARMGGDEFAVLCPGLAGPHDAEAIAARALDALAEPFEIDGQPITLDGSIGIALAPDDATTAEELMAAADAALYAAKRGGRARAERSGRGLAAPALAAGVSGAGTPAGRGALAADLREAVQTGRGFWLAFQPVIRAADASVHSFEALLRWQRDGHGSVSPADFIPLAETTGQIMALDRFVLRAACAEAAGWAPHLQLAVNISPIHLQFGNLVADVEAALDATGMDPHRLMLEITESTAISDARRARAAIEALGARGVGLALDDFGAGHASLTQLEQFPFDVVKLDRAMVAALGRNPRAEAVLRAAVQMGRALGATTLAEGIETEAEAALLRAEGCELLQGYLFGRPAPIETMAHLVRPAPPALVA
jgi:diguanylate cyclase (GGDEF)-like protein